MLYATEQMSTPLIPSRHVINANPFPQLDDYLKGIDPPGLASPIVGGWARYQARLREALTLRTVAELFAADYVRHLDVVAFSGFVFGVDKATGRDCRPHLISTRITRAALEQVDLSRVDARFVSAIS